MLQKWMAGRMTLQRVLLNSAWLAADNLFRLGVSFFVGAWVARYLGPEQFGLLNYAIAFCAPFSALVGLGLNGIVVRDLVREPGHAGEILGSAAGLKALAGLVSLLVCLGALAAAPAMETRAKWLVVVTIVGTSMQAADVFDLWFQSQSQARVSAWVRSVASLFVNAAKVALIILDAPVIWFAAAGGVELAVCGLGWWFVCRWRGRFVRWRVRGTRCGQLLRESWAVAVAGIALQIQAYFDQVLLATMRDANEVGLYAAAMRLVSVFAFIPMALNAAAAPEITRAFLDDRARYLRRLCHLYRIMVAVFIAIWMPLTLFSAPIVLVLFGAEYVATAGLLPLLVWRLLLTNVGVVRGIYLTNERMLGHAMGTAVIAALVNVGLNVVLIPVWGATGCVVASLTSFTVNTLALEGFDARARINLRVLFSAVTFCRLAS